MTRDEIIARFNPAANPNFTPEELETLRALTNEDIDALAAAYPNQPQGRSYLRLYDTGIKDPTKQLYQNSTWQNLRNVRKFAGLKNLIPWDFTATAQVRKAATRPATNPKAPNKRVVVDMSAQEAADELKKVIEQKQQPKKEAAIKKSVEQITAKKAEQKPAVKPAKKVPADQDFSNDPN